MTRRAGIPGYGSWFTNRELAGAGALFDMGVHALDLGLYVMGFPRPLVVQGATYDVMGRRGRGLGRWGADIIPGAGRFDVDDLASLMVHLEGAATLIVEAGWASYDLSVDSLTLLGTEAGARLIYGPNRGETDLRLFVDLPSGPAEIHPDYPWVESTYGELIAAFSQRFAPAAHRPSPSRRAWL